MNYPTWLQKYIERKFRLVFWARGRDPATWKGPREDGWQHIIHSPDEWKDGVTNVGVLLGTEIAPQQYLCDIDFDWTDGLPLAKNLLPATGFGFGRPSRTTSHAFYTTSQPLVSKAYHDIDGKTFVEIRGTKADGTLGFQTMLPPSIHPNGETLELKMDENIGHADDIGHRVILYAIACILFQHLGHRGLYHANRLAMAGFLLGDCSLPPDEVILIGRAVAAVTGNDTKDVETVVHSTATELRNGKHVQGKGALAKAIGGEKDKDGKKVIATIRGWLGGGDFLHDDKDRIYKDNQENIKRALTKLDAVLSFNDFAQTPIVQYNGYTGRLEDHMENQIWLDIDAKFQFRPTKLFYKDVVESVARHNTFHPVREYLGSLTWDQIPRLDTWLIQYAHAADSEYCRAVSSKVLVAAVRRVRQPGCKFDEILVLESGQGLLKSSALRSLCKNEEWFTDDLPLNADSKVVIERTAGKWIIECAELFGLKGGASEALKIMLSRQTDAARLAYGHRLSEIPRQWIAIGTTNHHVYLKDATGNRRFWPMQIQRFDVEGLKSVRDQLWAEAATRESSGESIRLSPHLYAYAELQQERRREEDPWEETFREYLADKDRAIPSKLWEVVHIAVDRQTTVDGKRIAEIMRRNGFRYMTIVWPKGEIGAKRVKGWKLVASQGDLLEDEEGES